MAACFQYFWPPGPQVPVLGTVRETQQLGKIASVTVFLPLPEHVRDIHSAAMRLAASPLMGRERDDLKPGIREVVVYPTVLFYRVSREQVEVVRAVDERRDIAAIFGED